MLIYAQNQVNGCDFMKKISLKDLTLREKIGQMANHSILTINNMLKNGNDAVNLMGSVWVYGAIDMRLINMGDDTTGEEIPAHHNWLFLNEMSKKNKIPLLGAMDCTSGINSAFYDMRFVASPCSLGAANSEELSFKTGVAKAKSLKCAGAKWLWGPEEDIPNRLASISLGRKLSDEPDLIIKLANAQNNGIQSEGVAATAKHFPGDDELEYRDSHVSETVYHKSLEEWRSRQGRVFKEIIDGGVYSVMVGHQAFPACDNTKIKGKYLPSTVSKKVVTDLLKGELGFKGVVITDAIGMRGLLNLFDNDINRVCIESVKAGCDVILAAPGGFVDAIEKAVLDGEIPESRIDDACSRILAMKEKLNLFEQPFEEMDSVAVAEECTAVSNLVAEKSLSLVCDNRKILPLNPEKHKKICIIFSGESERAYNSLKIIEEELYKRGVEKVHIQKGLGDEPEPSTLPLDFDIMLYVGHAGLQEPWGMVGFQGETFKTFYRVAAGGQIGKRVAVSIGSPYLYFDYYEGFDCFINAYTYHESTLRALVKALYGEIGFEGGHPFKLIPAGFDVNY